MALALSVGLWLVLSVSISNAIGLQLVVTTSPDKKKTIYLYYDLHLNHRTLAKQQAEWAIPVIKQLYKDPTARCLIEGIGAQGEDFFHFSDGPEAIVYTSTAPRPLVCADCQKQVYRGITDTPFFAGCSGSHQFIFYLHEGIDPAHWSHTFVDNRVTLQHFFKRQLHIVDGALHTAFGAVTPNGELADQFTMRNTLGHALNLCNYFYRQAFALYSLPNIPDQCHNDLTVFLLKILAIEKHITVLDTYIAHKLGLNDDRFTSFNELCQVAQQSADACIYSHNHVPHVALSLESHRAFCLGAQYEQFFSLIDRICSSESSQGGSALGLFDIELLYTILCTPHIHLVVIFAGSAHQQLVAQFLRQWGYTVNYNSRLGQPDLYEQYKHLHNQVNQELQPLYDQDKEQCQQILQDRREEIIMELKPLGKKDFELPLERLTQVLKLPEAK